jgi:tetratricopeptide (TPR) repeat protein
MKRTSHQIQPSQFRLAPIVIGVKRSGRSRLLPPLLIVIICFLIYSNTFEASFHLDDWKNIVENRYLHLKELSLSNLVAAIRGPSSRRPVSILSFSLNHYFGGLNVIGYHLVNLFIHALAGIILYFLLVTTLALGPLRGKYERSEWLALTVTLLWVVHPVQTQSVTYIVQRMNSMAGMFFLLSLYLYVRGRLGETTRVKVWFYSGSGVAGLLALGSKEIAGVLPIMLVLYEFYFLQGLDLHAVRRKWPWLIGILVIFLIIALVYLGPNFIRGILTLYQYKDFTLAERLLTQLRVVIYYLSLLVFPSPSRLNLDYDFKVSHSLLAPVSTFFSFLVLLGLVGLGVYLARRRPLASFGIFWFLGNLVVESSVIALDMAFEHRLYLPLLGFLLFLVGIFKSEVKKGFIYGTFSVILIFSFWTIQRNIVWNNEFTLWSDCVKKSPNKARPHNNLGVAYAKEGIYDEAIKECQQALELDPDSAESFYNLGIAYAKEEMHDEAIRVYQQAVEIKPDFAKAFCNLGDVFSDKGMYDQAIREYQRAVEIDPEFARAFYNLGIAYAKVGMHDEAIREKKKALELDPDFAEAHVNLAIAYGEGGMYDEAIIEYQQALKLNPDNAELFYNLGNAYSNKGMYDQAIREYQQAVEIKPDFAEAHVNLGIAYAKEGTYNKAIREYHQALRLKPDSAEACYNLGDAYSNKGMYDEAIREYQRVLEIIPNFAAAHYKLGLIYYYQKQYDLGVRYIKNAERLGYPIPLALMEMLENVSK